MHAREVHAHETHAYEIHALEMHAHLTNGGAVVVFALRDSVGAGVRVAHRSRAPDVRIANRI